MMRRSIKRTAIATVLGTTALFAGVLTANAATITSADEKFAMETPNKNWKEVSDQNTKMTLTNGSDYVTVNRYDKEDVLQDLEKNLPMPTVAHDEFEEEFLAYYSTDKDVYMITGLADKKEDIDEVRSVVNSIQLADHQKSEKKADNEKKENKEEKKKAEKTDEMYTLYNEEGKQVIIYKYTDGEYRSEDGTRFQWVEDGKWVDYYGNHYTTNGTSDKAERTGKSIDLTSENGDLVVVYKYTDGSYRSDEGTVFQNVDGNEFVDYYGNHYYKDYVPQDNDTQEEDKDDDNQIEDTDNDDQEDVQDDNNQANDQDDNELQGDTDNDNNIVSDNNENVIVDCQA